MELYTLVEKANKKELIASTGCKLHEYEGNVLIKYPHGVTLDDEEGGWLKYCRGAVYTTEGEVVNVPPVRFKEGEPENKEGFMIQEYLDGTMMNVWFNKKWYISTRSKIGALCKWHTDKTFRHMFLDIVDEKNGNFDILDETRSYSFVMLHTDNRIVQKYNKNRIVLASIFNKETKEYETPKDFYNTLTDTYDPWFSLPAEYASVDMKKENVVHHAGYVYCNGNEKYKVLHPKYNDVKKLNGDSHSSLFNYVENRRNGRLPEYLKYFPENRRVYNHMKYKIHDLTQLIYDTYGLVFKEKQYKLKDIPFSLKPLVYELHGMYLETKKAIGFTDVMGYINNLPSARLVFVISKITKDIEDHVKKQGDDIDKLSECMDKLDMDKVEELFKNIKGDEDITEFLNKKVSELSDEIVEP